MGWSCHREGLPGRHASLSFLQKTEPAPFEWPVREEGARPRAIGEACQKSRISQLPPRPARALPSPTNAAKPHLPLAPLRPMPKILRKKPARSPAASTEPPSRQRSSQYISMQAYSPSGISSSSGPTRKQRVAAAAIWGQIWCRYIMAGERRVESGWLPVEVGVAFFQPLCARRHSARGSAFGGLADSGSRPWSSPAPPPPVAPAAEKVRAGPRPNPPPQDRPATMKISVRQAMVQYLETALGLAPEGGQPGPPRLRRVRTKCSGRGDPCIKGEPACLRVLYGAPLPKPSVSGGMPELHAGARVLPGNAGRVLPEPPGAVEEGVYHVVAHAFYLDFGPREAGGIAGDMVLDAAGSKES